MIPSSPWLWRNVIFARMVLCLNALVIFALVMTLIRPSSRRKAPVLAFYIAYSISTSTFALITLCVVLKKAMNGTFGYDNARTLIKKFRVFAGLAFVFANLVLGFIIFMDSSSSTLFALSSFINALCCGILARTYILEHYGIRRYLHAITLANSHKGLTISPEEAQMCCQLEVEMTKVQSSLTNKTLSTNTEAIRNVQFYYMMRWLHKLQLLMAADERERLWRTTELYHEIQTQAFNLQLEDSNAEVWKKLAGQLGIYFSFSEDMQESYSSVHVCNELESVD